MEPEIEEFWKKHEEVLPRKPEISVANISHITYILIIRMFFHKGNAKLLYDLQPELLRNILDRLDEFRMKRK